MNVSSFTRLLRFTHGAASGASILLATAISTVAAPPNDHFENATPLSGSDVTLNATSVGATRQLGEHPRIGLNSVWWKWTAPGHGELDIKCTELGFVAGVSVFVGDSLTSLSAAASGRAVLSHEPDVRVPVAMGTTYLIAVGAGTPTAPYGGPIELSLKFKPSAGPGAVVGADDYTKRPVLTGEEATGIANTFFAGTTQPGEATVGLGGGGVWWQWTAPHSTTTVLDTHGSDFGTVVSVYEGTRLDQLALVSQGRELKPPYTGRASFKASQGTTYQIKLSGDAACLVPPGCSGNGIVRLAQIDLPPEDFTISHAVLVELTPRPGKTYQLQQSADLVHWGNIGDLFTPTQSVVQWFFPAHPGSNSFYRARRIEP